MIATIQHLVKRITHYMNIYIIYVYNYNINTLIRFGNRHLEMNLRMYISVLTNETVFVVGKNM